MFIFLKSLLVIHILAGYMALVCGAAAMITRKGGKRHRKWGRVFYYSMIAVSVTAIILAFARDIYFLLYIGIFVFYQNHGGWRALRNKSLVPGFTDWVILCAAFVNGIAMIYTAEIVLLVFGGISMVLVTSDLRLYIPAVRGKKLPPKAWLAKHIGMMMGAYIGTFTAFLVVNVKVVQPYWILWLAPTVLLVPLMRYWTWKYTIKPTK
jgi:hypothetical protein